MINYITQTATSKQMELKKQDA